jgi:hypothetical protein
VRYSNVVVSFVSRARSDPEAEFFTFHRRTMDGFSTVSERSLNRTTRSTPPSIYIEAILISIFMGNWRRIVQGAGTITRYQPITGGAGEDAFDDDEATSMRDYTLKPDPDEHSKR